MIHCLDERDPATMVGKHTLEVQTMPPISIKVNLRPGLIDSLLELKKSYQLVSFTASDKIYADTILDFIEEDHSIFSARLYRP